MIDRGEIEAKAKEFQVHASNIQKDYVFGWFLAGLFQVSDLRETIFLKGGNALRKGYFSQTRYSSDLDFGIPGDIDPALLLMEINKVCEFIAARTGVSFVTGNNRVEEKFTATETPLPDLRVWEARVYFKDFYGKADHITLRITMDITRFDKVLLPIQTVPLIHPYSDADAIACDIRCMKLEEIIATKLKCLMQRQHAPDLFDYAYSIQLLGGSLDRGEVVRALVEKTIFGRNPHVLKGILKSTPFESFRRHWAKGVVCAKAALIAVEDAVTLFLGDLDDLFSPYTDSGFAQFAYFPAEMRAPILKAGRDQTLMRIRYNGADRLVEPYSLKYLQMRNGEQKEYFYVWNLSGGSSAPGVRSLVPAGLQSVENTDEKFEPRFLVEMSKAGERPEDPYLFDPNKPTRAPKGRRSSSGRIASLVPRRAKAFGAPKHTYQCSYCGKKSTKTTQNSSLRPHKDKQGYPCGGRYGIFVGTTY